VKPQTIGLLVGGLGPALGYAIFAIATKFASQAGLGAGPLLVLVGAACVACGAVFWKIMPAGLSTTSAAWGLVAGLAWAIGSGLVSVALSRWNVPISKLNPIYNTNTLITVLLGLVIFSEWKEANPLPLLGGAALILAGSLLVSNA